ncbi:MAG: 30S ribosomal protein S4 [Bdellovibrionaceae bacterium]|nr:30S ribosomal protein S4 [Pseudobdellovibrionaceae bacterium]
MARYTGPRSKISRRFGVPLFGDTKALEKRPYPPGVHGSRRRKLSDYGVALNEKQKLKAMYGVLERQFRRYFEIAQRRRGVTGETLLQLLETRLDNMVFRLGFSTTRRGARQMVTHGHIQVNGRRVNIASYCCRVGDVIEVRNHPKARQLATHALEASSLNPVPDWMLLDKDAFKGTVGRIPTRDEIAPIVNERLIVELCSR